MFKWRVVAVKYRGEKAVRKSFKDEFEAYRFFEECFNNGYRATIKRVVF